MKKIIVSFLLAASLQLTASEVPVPMIINRTGQEIRVAFKDGSSDLFTVNNSIMLAGNADHAADQMVLIPSTSIDKPGSSPVAKYQSSATGARVTIGTKSITLTPFAANKSYVIEASTTAGNFKATPGLIKYNPTTGAGTPGTGFTVQPGSGF